MPIRVARKTVPGRAGLTSRAWVSIMPSVLVSLPIRLLRWSRSTRSSSAGVQSCQVSPASELRITPPTSSPAYTSSGLLGSVVIRITRMGKPMCTPPCVSSTASRRQLSPPLSLRYTTAGAVPRYMMSGFWG